MRFDKSVDKLKGGAIDSVKKVESGEPSFTIPSDYRQIMQDLAVDQSTQGDRMMYYRSALDMIPRNIQPYTSYEHILQASGEDKTTSILSKELSGHGAHRDKPHIANAVVHSLKHHPDILKMYLNGRV